MVRRDHENEPVDAERQDLETCYFDCAGDDSDVGRALGDGGENLVAQPILQIDVHLRMRSEKIAERLWQQLGRRIGIGHQPNLALYALRVLRQVAMHSLGLLQQYPRMVSEGAAVRRRLDPL